MDINQLIDLAEVGAAGVIIILLGMIKIPKLRFNFWEWFGHIIGKAINKEVIEKVEGVSKELNDFKESEDLQRAIQARRRILRFSDEILFGQRHSKEHFDEILDDIDSYERYCQEHKTYKNNRAVLAIATIRETYADCVQTHDFLSYTKK